MLGGLIDVGTGLIGAGLNYYGTKKANEMNKKLSREQMGFQREANEKAMGFSRDSAHEQMAFQERMSNTSYQRAMEDMKQAGINPILAFNQGGASTPSGSSPGGVSSGGAKANVMNEFAGAAATAMQMRAISAQIDQTKMMTKLMEAELPEKQRSSDIYKSRAGTVLKWFKEIMNPLEKAVNSGSSAARAASLLKR